MTAISIVFGNDYNPVMLTHIKVEDWNKLSGVKFFVASLHVDSVTDSSHFCEFC